jgi:hypothetical protein
MVALCLAGYDRLSGATHFGLIHALREHEFVCQLDPAFVEEHSTEPQEELSDDELHGMSGGPAFLVRQGRSLFRISAE